MIPFGWEMTMYAAVSSLTNAVPWVLVLKPSCSSWSLEGIELCTWERSGRLMSRGPESCWMRIMPWDVESGDSLSKLTPAETLSTGDFNCTTGVRGSFPTIYRRLGISNAAKYVEKGNMRLSLPAPGRSACKILVGYYEQAKIDSYSGPFTDCIHRWRSRRVDIPYIPSISIAMNVIICLGPREDIASITAEARSPELSFDL